MILSESNLLIYAASSYTNSNCVSTEEFLEDMRRIHLVKKLFVKYKKSGEMNERLVLNHFVALYNVFLPRQCTRMLFLELQDHWDLLIPFLAILNYLPPKVDNIEGFPPIIPNDIIYDTNIKDRITNTLKE